MALCLIKYTRSACLLRQDMLDGIFKQTLSDPSFRDPNGDSMKTARMSNAMNVQIAIGCLI